MVVGLISVGMVGFVTGGGGGEGGCCGQSWVCGGV